MPQLTRGERIFLWTAPGVILLIVAACLTVVFIQPVDRQTCGFSQMNFLVTPAPKVANL